MKKYFLLQRSSIDINVPSEQIDLYRNMIIEEMKKLGATDDEIKLLHQETIINSIINNRIPEDVAWAILQ